MSQIRYSTPVKLFSYFQNFKVKNYKKDLNLDHQDQTPKLGGMYKFLEQLKQEEINEQLLMATKKSHRFIKMTDQKDLKEEINQSARKLNFNDSNPILKRTVLKQETSNSLDVSECIFNLDFERNKSYNEKCFEVFEKFVSNFNRRNEKILEIFNSKSQFKILHEPIHTVQKTIKALANNYEKF